MSELARRVYDEIRNGRTSGQKYRVYALRDGIQAVFPVWAENDSEVTDKAREMGMTPDFDSIEIVHFEPYEQGSSKRFAQL